MEWRFVIHNQASEPYDEAAIQKLIDVKLVGPGTLAWRTGMTDWKAARDIPELAGLFPAEATPTPAAEEVPPVPGSSVPPSPAGASAPPPPPSSADWATATVWQERARKFVFWFFRPWKGRPSKVRAYVDADPKRAIPVAIGVIVGLYLLLSMVVAPFSESGSGGGGGGGMAGGGGMPAGGGGNTMENWHIARDAQRYNQNVIDDVYKYNRDSFDQQSETYRRANYDWYNNNNNGD